MRNINGCNRKTTELLNREWEIGEVELSFLVVSGV